MITLKPIDFLYKWSNRIFNKKSVIIFIRILIGIILTLYVIDFIFPFKSAIKFSRIVEAKDGSLLRGYLSEDQKWRLPISYDQLPENFVKSILFKEDQYFYYHVGVNPFSVMRALVDNLTFGKRTSGASTITMQVVRLLEPRPRTYLNKITEILRAIQLEWHYDKKEILEMYVNLLPYGGNIEGVRSASWLYFQKPVSNLSLAQCVVLSVIPNKPNSLRFDNQTMAIIEARNRWLYKMKNTGIISAHEFNVALNEPLDARRRNMPFIAPHFSNRVLKLKPEKTIIRTTLDFYLQIKAEQCLKNYINQINHTGISNACAIIIHNPTREIRAYVGSSDFWNTIHEGQNDGIKAIRSPGSTLKPFLYASVYQNGHYTPKQKILDVPTDFDGFEPENYDRTFRGKISVEEALSQSLNIPAVKLLQRQGTESFRQLLISGGAKTLEKYQGNNRLGLSMILGGCGVRLDELTNLYANIASGGRYKSFTMFPEDSLSSSSFQWFSEESCFLVTQSLTNLKRPDYPTSAEYAHSTHKIAWKTGTSNNRRDAWAIGYQSEYTVGVWVGNFNGESNQYISGADMATPLLFQLFQNIHKPSKWFSVPKGLARRNVCAESGLLPADFCQNKISDYYIPQSNFTKQCDHLQWRWVSEDEKISYCVNCLPTITAHQKLYPNIEPELVHFYESQKISYIQVPPHYSGCVQKHADQKLKIISPLDGTEIICTDGKSQRIMLKATADNSINQIHWFINKKYYQSCTITDKVYFEADTGNYIITCTDESGFKAVSRIRISK